MQLSNIEIIVRILVAIMCGALVGWERERREKAAGLRTHMFVSMGSALIMIISSFGFSDALEKGVVMLDPSRIAAQVVSGISFLGAGVIWFNRNKVRGLDTAAGIWATSAIGLAAGCGMYIPAFVVTLAMLVMNIALKPIEERLFPRSKSARLIIELSDDSRLDDINLVLASAGLKVRGLRMAENSDTGTLGLDINAPKGTDWFTVAGKVKTLAGVSSVSFNEPSERFSDL